MECVSCRVLWGSLRYGTCMCACTVGNVFNASNACRVCSVCNACNIWNVSIQRNVCQICMHALSGSGRAVLALQCVRLLTTLSLLSHMWVEHRFHLYVRQNANTQEAWRTTFYLERKQYNTKTEGGILKTYLTNQRVRRRRWGGHRQRRQRPWRHGQRQQHRRGRRWGRRRKRRRQWRNWQWPTRRLAISCMCHCVTLLALTAHLCL